MESCLSQKREPPRTFAENEVDKAKDLTKKYADKAYRSTKRHFAKRGTPTGIRKPQKQTITSSSVASSTRARTRTLTRRITTDSANRKVQFEELFRESVERKIKAYVVSLPQGFLGLPDSSKESYLGTKSPKQEVKK